MEEVAVEQGMAAGVEYSRAVAAVAVYGVAGADSFVLDAADCEVTCMGTDAWVFWEIPSWRKLQLSRAWLQASSNHVPWLRLQWMLLLVRILLCWMPQMLRKPLGLRRSFSSWSSAFAWPWNLGPS